MSSALEMLGFFITISVKNILQAAQYPPPSMVSFFIVAVDSSTCNPFKFGQTTSERTSVTSGLESFRKCVFICFTSSSKLAFIALLISFMSINSPFRILVKCAPWGSKCSITLPLFLYISRFACPDLGIINPNGITKASDVFLEMHLNTFNA